MTGETSNRTKPIRRLVATFPINGSRTTGYAVYILEDANGVQIDDPLSFVCVDRNGHSPERYSRSIREAIDHCLANSGWGDGSDLR